MKWLIRFGWFIVFMSIPGCISYYILKPVHPGVGNPNKNPHRVDSLQPTLSWEASPDTAISYDLIIFEGIKDVSFWKGVKRNIGEQVYYREGIPANSHTIEKVLKPNTEYYWSIRIRKGSEVTQWANYDYTLYLVLSYINVRDALFRFWIPDVKK